MSLTLTFPQPNESFSFHVYVTQTLTPTPFPDPVSSLAIVDKVITNVLPLQYVYQTSIQYKGGGERFVPDVQF